MAPRRTLQIRPEQMRELGSEARKDAEERISAEMAEIAGPGGDGTALMKRALNDSALYGLERECDIVSYARMLGSAERELTKAEQNVLLAHGVSGRDKIETLLRLRGQNTPGAASSRTQAPGSIVWHCPLERENSPVYFIEIELVGEDDSPIPWEEYRVKLPTGETVRGYLDDDGWARIDNIKQPGMCEVTFPKVDEEAWERHATSRLPERQAAAEHATVGA